MGKLIRAEFYRTKKLNGFWICVLISFLMMILVPFVNNSNAEHTASTFFLNTMSEVTILGMMISLMAAYITGRGYHHRTCMYEVMAGNSPSRIIVSKCLSIALPFALVVYVPHLIGLGIACGINSGGISDVLPREPFFLLTLIRLTCFGTLITMCVRSMLGPGLVYVRLLLESIAMIVISAVTGTDIMDGGADLLVGNTTSSIVNIAFLGEQGVVLAEPFGEKLVMQSVTGCVVEIALWTAVAMLVYRKKDY